MMRFDVRKAVAVFAAVAMMGVAGPVAVSAANAADAPAAAQTAAQITVNFKYTDKQGNETWTSHTYGVAGGSFADFEKQAVADHGTPSLDGYKFTGWTDNKSLFYAPGSTDPVKAGVDLYPAYVQDPAAEQATVKFHYTNKSGDVVKTVEVVGDKGAAFSEFTKDAKYETPSLAGYKFTGWATLDLSQFFKADSADKVTGDLDVYSQYVQDPAAEQVTLTFHGKDGQPGWPVRVTLDKDSVFSEFAKGLDGYALPSLPGYTLKGWSYKDNGPVFEGDVRMGSSIDVFPVFEKNPVEQVTVTFHGRDGQPGWPVAVTLDKGSKFYEFQNKFDKTVPTVDGFDFVGWSKDIHNVDADHLIDSLYEVNDSIDAFPVYVAAEQPAPAKVNVTFLDKDGNPLANRDGQAGDLFGSFAAPEAPAVPGKVFTGWALPGGALAEEGYAVNEDLTVTATYKTVYQPQPQFPWWGNWWNAFQHWWGSWTQWGHGWWW